LAGGLVINAADGLVTDAPKVLADMQRHFVKGLQIIRQTFGR